MATLRDLLALKGAHVVDVRPADSVRHSADLMNQRNIGAVVVLDGDRLAGIFTERDVLRRVVAAGLDPAATPVETVMTAPVITAEPEMNLDDCAALLTARGIRHLPVLDGERLAGVVSIRDLLAYKVGDQQTTIAQMNNYLYDVR